VFDKIIKKRPVIMDGAIGTTLALMGSDSPCSVLLNLSDPELVKKLHVDYLKAGSDIVLTNTFEGSSIALAEHSASAEFENINREAVKIARKALSDFGGNDKFIAGDIGPTSKLPTISHISFHDLYESYLSQASIMIDEGVDLIYIETCQDPLQFKAALAASRAALAKYKKNIPILVSITIESSGKMLLGTEIDAALYCASPYRPFAFGLNCGLGPQGMRQHLAGLSERSPFHLICKPNAGTPGSEGGRAIYRMSAADFASELYDYALRYKVSFVGGCCGTTPDHIAKLSSLVKGCGRFSARRNYPEVIAGVSSLYLALDFDQEPSPFIVAEQTNVNGSKKFREMLEHDNFDAMVSMIGEAAASSHALDICLELPGRDEVQDFCRLVPQAALKSEIPFMIDSTNPDVIEEALSRIPGRSIINSINLGDGGGKASHILSLAKKYGAAVVALVIDEDGMATDAKKKIAVAQRLVKICEDHGLGRESLFIDPLTFTLASGDAGLVKSASETLAAIPLIKKKLKGVRTILGVSNVSFGLRQPGRKYLTSVFLYRAIRAGLDAAIINPSGILPYASIPKEKTRLCDSLIDGKKASALSDFMKGMGDVVPSEVVLQGTSKKISKEDRLRGKIISGDRSEIVEIVDDLVASGTDPQHLIGSVLLPAMEGVGKRFGAGEIPLPFVLQSAEVMKKAIDAATKFLSGKTFEKKGKIVLATVMGDVHDIGKDLVDAILSNNGYEVINLGIKQPASAIMEAIEKSGADAIGLSGLLVSSTEIMRENLAEFRKNGISVPVLCGGAALKSSFVNEVLAREYSSRVYYCKDAFAGFEAMEKIMGRR